MEASDVIHYWRGILQRKLLILVTTLLGVGVSWCLAYYVVKPEYTATTSVLINQPQTNNAVLYDSIIADQALVNTYTGIIKSDALAEKVITALNLPYSTNQLSAMLQVTTPSQSQIIDVTALAPSESQAVAIVNQTAEAFRQFAAQLMGLNNVQVIDVAKTNPHATPAKPNKKLSLAVGFLAGITVGIVLALLLERFDRRIKSEDEARDYFGLPVLGVIGTHK